MAFWTPQEPVNAGHELRVAYSLLWSLQPPLETGLLPVLSTRVGAGGEPGGDRPADLRRVAIEFAAAGGRAPRPAPCRRPWWNATMASARPPSSAANEVTGGYQVTFDVRLGGNPVELRCFLAQDGKPVSETWLYRLDNS